MKGPRGRAFLVAVVLAAGLPGCGGGAAVPGGDGGSREQTQARQALARWAEAVHAAGGQSFAPVGDLTGQRGNWEPAVADNAKLALLAGSLTATAALPTTRPAGGVVTWQDGTTATVQVAAADEALRSLTAAGDHKSCFACTPLRVTGAHLGTAEVQTTRGPARAPAWEYTLDGTTVVVTRVAVAAGQVVTVTPPPWNAADPPAGLSIDDATVSPDGMTLTAGFVGAPGPASQPCGADYSGQAVESDTAVVVVIAVHVHGGDGACAAVGSRRTATVRLSRALGPRAVLEVRQGLPVPTRSAPAP